MNAVVETKLLKLNLGCGKDIRKDWVNVDVRAFEGVDVICNLAEQRDYQGSSLGFKPWPWPDDSVEEAHMSHMLEHFTALERMFVFNELYRVLVKGGKATIITPWWASGRAYGDPTHRWPPVCEMSYYYLNREWRMANAPHTDSQWMKGGYNCDFDHSGGYTWHPEVAVRNAEYQMYAAKFLKESAQDLIVTVVRRT